MSTFRGELLPLLGRTVTVSTECATITGTLIRVGLDKIVVRTALHRFIIRIAQICFVRRPL